MQVRTHNTQIIFHSCVASIAHQGFQVCNMNMCAIMTGMCEQG